MPGSNPLSDHVYLHNGRKLADTIPVYDHADSVLFHADRTKAIALMARQDVVIIGTRKRISALRLQGPDPAHLTGGSHHRRPIGSPHRKGNYYNVRGVWHIDRIPDTYEPLFNSLVIELSK